MSFTTTKLMAATAGASTGPSPGTYFATTNVGATSPWNDVNYCNSICVDSQNNVYSLWNIASNNTYNGVLLKQDLDGNVQWKRYWDAGQGYGYSAAAVQVDSSDRPHVYCVSYIPDVYNNSVNLTCINPSTGATNYQLTIFDPDYSDGQGTNGTEGSPNCLYIDENDKLYFISRSNSNSSSNKEGVLTGIYSIGASSYTKVVATRIGQSVDTGVCYAVGAYNSELIAAGGAGSPRQYFVVTHDTSGTEQSKYNASTVYGRYIDSNTGDFYATYYVTNEADIVVHKFNSSGVRQWSRRLNENTSYISRVFWYYNDITVDLDGNVYLLCTVDKLSPGAYYRPCVVKMNSSGTVQWVRGITWSQNTDVRAMFISTDTTGSIYIGTDNLGITIKMPADGSLTGSWSLGGYTLAITSDQWLTSGAGGGVDNLGTGSVGVSGTINPTTYAAVDWYNLSPSPSTTLNLT